MVKAVFDNSFLRVEDFSDSDLTKASLREAIIDDAIFDGALLSDTTWVTYKRCRAGSVGECR